MLSVEENIKKFIEETNDEEIDLYQPSGILLDKMLVHLKYIESRDLGCITISDLVKRVEYNLNHKRE